MSRRRFPNQMIRDLSIWAKEQGFDWERTGSGHIRWTHPAIAGPIFTACTPRSNGGVEERKKLERALRRMAG